MSHDGTFTFGVETVPSGDSFGGCDTRSHDGTGALSRLQELHQVEQVVAVRRGPSIIFGAVGAAQSTDIVRLFVDWPPVIAAPRTDDLVSAWLRGSD